MGHSAESWLETSFIHSFIHHHYCILQAEYVNAKNLAGMMVWSLAFDDVHGHCGDGQYPLMTTMKAVLLGYDPHSPVTAYPIVFIPTREPKCGKCIDISW